jgi:hypothetical protein
MKFPNTAQEFNEDPLDWLACFSEDSVEWGPKARYDTTSRVLLVVVDISVRFVPSADPSTRKQTMDLLVFLLAATCSFVNVGSHSSLFHQTSSFIVLATSGPYAASL